MNFFSPLIHELVSRGHQVDIACNDEDSPVPPIFRALGCEVTSISCTRSPFHAGSIKAVSQLRRLIRLNQYNIVHCHTPVASFCTRLACRNLTCKVFYTAHGFHFYKGAPLKNWILYYTAEKLCAPLTDTLITINQEDYALAKNKLRAGRVLYVPGVGINMDKFRPDVQAISPCDLDIPDRNRVILSVGELSRRKNHEVLIRAVAQMQNITILLVGAGPLEQELKDLACHIGCDVRFLGRRSDIAALCNTCDLFVLPSLQEGLPVALMEAMACGKAVSCSQIRGNTDLLTPTGGTFFDPHSADDCRNALETALGSDLAAMGQHNRETVRKFSLESVNKQMLQIYES